MYQVFYIENDEEITSIIDRLRKSDATEIFFAVSPRALILQSVVSLKLLKKEASGQKKQIAIVVNDNESKMKIEKAGILALDSLKGMDEGDEIKENFSAEIKIKNNNQRNYKNNMEKESKKGRLQKIGTEEFFNEKENIKGKSLPQKKEIGKMRINEINTVSKSNDSISEKGTVFSKNSLDVQRENPSFSYIPEKNFEEVTPNFGDRKNYIRNPGGVDGSRNMDPYKEKLLEGFFRPETRLDDFNQMSSKISGEKTEKISVVSHKMKKAVIGFFAVCLIAAAVLAYVFAPKASITVFAKNEAKKIDANIKGSAKETGVTVSELVIPAKIIEKEDSLSISFKSTGTKASSSDASQKAKGKITIYNEYGKDPQQLVATTRFLSSSGKLFRLTKGVTIPGMVENKPGSIEADVIADSPGEEYNIGSSNFKIPGFEGGAKYDKFYAKSAASMSGGVSKSGGVSAISQSDLDNAKKNSEAKIKDQLKEKIKNEAGAGYVLLPEAFEETIAESSSDSRLNEAIGSFNYTVKGKIKAVVFLEGAVQKIAAGLYERNNNPVSDYSSIKISYGTSSVDFSAETLNIKFSAAVPSSADINLSELKKNLLGKNDAEIKEILNAYPRIEKIDVDFWPKFMSQRIPQYASRVTVELKNSSD